MVVKVDFPIKARPKGRPRFRSLGKYVQTYTDKNTSTYEETIQAMYKEKCGYNFEYAPLKVRVILNYAPPKSATKKHKAELLSSPHIIKPDVDNCLKSIFDGLNGTAYHDDNQIFECYVLKRWNNEDMIHLEITDEVDYVWQEM